MVSVGSADSRSSVGRAAATTSSPARYDVSTSSARTPMPYRVPVASVSTQPSSTRVRSSMYRLDLGYPTASWTAARECIPGRPAKYSSNSTVRTADLTCAPPPVSAADIALDPFVRREIVSNSIFTIRDSVQHIERPGGWPRYCGITAQDIRKTYLE